MHSGLLLPSLVIDQSDVSEANVQSVEASISMKASAINHMFYISQAQALKTKPSRLTTFMPGIVPSGI